MGIVVFILGMFNGLNDCLKSITKRTCKCMYNVHVCHVTGCESPDGGCYAPGDSAKFSAVMSDGKTWSNCRCEVYGENGHQTKCTSGQPENSCLGMLLLLSRKSKVDL